LILGGASRPYLSANETAPGQPLKPGERQTVRGVRPFSPTEANGSHSNKVRVPINRQEIDLVTAVGNLVRLVLGKIVAQFTLEISCDDSHGQSSRL
jgi:hypothetical protein